MQETFENRVAVVTGAASGVGLATTVAFAGAGAAVVAADIDADASEHVLGLIEQAGGKGHYVPTDVTDARSVEALLDEVIDTYGALHYAVNCAGIDVVHTPLPEALEADWDRILAVNLKGLWLSMRFEMPAIRASGGGAIVNLSSRAGVQGVPGASPYAASKHGVVGLTRTAALDDPTIRINALCPAGVDTPLLGQVLGDDVYARRVAEGTLLEPQSVAQTVLWLCSDRNNLVTGQAFVV